MENLLLIIIILLILDIMHREFVEFRRHLLSKKSTMEEKHSNLVWLTRHDSSYSTEAIMERLAKVKHIKKRSLWLRIKDKKKSLWLKIKGRRLK